MKWSVAGLLVLGVVAALCATFLVTALIAGAQRGVTAAGAAPTTEVEVLVAERALPALAVVSQSDVVVRQVPADQLSPGFLSNPVQVVGKVLAAPMAEGQVFHGGAFAQGPGMHLAAALPEGRRAMTVSLNTASGLEGLLYPGSVVDVVASFRPTSHETNRRTEAVSTMLLQSVPVLAVEQQTVVSSEERLPVDSRMHTRARLVTLMVDAEQAKALQLAQEYGVISLVMRNPLDAHASSAGVTMLSDLALLEHPAPLSSEELLAAFDQSQDRVITSLEMMLDQRAAPTASAGDAAGDAPAQPTVADEPQATSSAALPPPPWETIIIRGSQVETRSFEQSEEAPGATAEATP